ILLWSYSQPHSQPNLSTALSWYFYGSHSLSKASDLKRKIRLAREAVQDEPNPYKLEAFKVILSRLIEQASMNAILPEDYGKASKIKPIKVNGKSLKINPKVLELGKFYLFRWKRDNYSVRKISKSKIEVYEVIEA
ncbi:MAG: hypothetical protein ACRD38_09505, partial [Nitrososphaerales archaeon]